MELGLPSPFVWGSQGKLVQQTWLFVPYLANVWDAVLTASDSEMLQKEHQAYFPSLIASGLCDCWKTCSGHTSAVGVNWAGPSQCVLVCESTVGFQLGLSPLLDVPLAVGAKEVSGAQKINPSSDREEWEGVLVFVVIPRGVLERNDKEQKGDKKK